MEKFLVAAKTERDHETCDDPRVGGADQSLCQNPQTLTHLTKGRE